MYTNVFQFRNTYISKTWLHQLTCSMCVLGFEEANNTFAMKAPRSKQKRTVFCVSPAHNWQAIVTVTASNSLQTAVLNRLRYYQKPRITALTSEKQNRTTIKSALKFVNNEKKNPKITGLMYAGCSKSNATYIIMSVHNVRHSCW